MSSPLSLRSPCPPSTLLGVELDFMQRPSSSSSSSLWKPFSSSTSCLPFLKLGDKRDKSGKPDCRRGRSVQLEVSHSFKSFIDWKLDGSILSLVEVNQAIL